MGRHDPSRKRRSHKWKVRRSLKIRIGTQPKQPEKVSSEKEPDEQRTITPNLKAMAPLLWASDYTPLLAKEQSELASLGLLESAVNLKAQAPQSTYMARGGGMEVFCFPFAATKAGIDLARRRWWRARARLNFAVRHADDCFPLVNSPERDVCKSARAIDVVH